MPPQNENHPTDQITRMRNAKFVDVYASKSEPSHFQKGEMVEVKNIVAGFSVSGQIINVCQMGQKQLLQVHYPQQTHPSLNSPFNSRDWIPAEWCERAERK